MKKAYIKAIDYYLPQSILSNEEITERFPEWSAEKVASKVGIKYRHISGENETALDMACAAAEKVFDKNPNLRDEIDFVILCSQSVDFKLPSSACIIQDRLQLTKHCGAFDFNLGCSGYEYGLAIAKGLILANIAQNVLLLTAETYSKYINPLDRGNLTLFGDAATATIISNTGVAEIADFDLGTDGSGAESLIVKTGGARHPVKNGNSNVDANGNLRWDDNLYMDGGAVFDFTSNVVPEMINNLLLKSGLNKDDISLWIFHQANKYMINYLRKLVGIEKDKFFVYIENVGNTVSSTIPIAIVEAIKEDRMHGYVLLAGFGVGLSWGATLLKCN